MSEPITLYDKNGKAVTVHGPSYAAGLVADGQYRYEPPARTAEKAEAKTEEPAAKTGKGK